MEELAFRFFNSLRNKVSSEHYLQMMFSLIFIAYEYDKPKNDELKNLVFSDQKILDKMVPKLTGVKDDVLYFIKQSVNLGYIECFDGLNEIFYKLTQLSDEQLIALYECLILNGSKYDLITYKDNYSPNELINIALAIADNTCDKLEVLDLCSGKGAFITLASNRLPKSRFTGIEINPNNTIILEMYSMMTGKNISVINSDCLDIELSKKYDFIFTQFPMNINVKSWELDNNKQSRFDRSTIRKNANFAFIFKGLDLLENNGKMVAVVNNGCLFNQSDLLNRKQLIDQGIVEAVINMPAGTLVGTQVRYSLLILSSNNKYVSFLDASNYYKMIDRNKVIDDKKIIDVLYLDNPKEIKRICYEDIINADYKLNIESYINDIDIDLQNSRRLGDIASVSAGLQYLSKNVEELPAKQGAYDVIHAADIDDMGEICLDKLASINISEKKAEKFILQENDILIASKGSVVKIALFRGSKRETIAYSNLMVIRVIDDSVDPVYLYSLLNSEVGRILIDRINSGNVILHILRKDLENMIIPVIDMEEQEIKKMQYIKLRETLIEHQRKVVSIKDKISSLYKEMLE